jgi:hypothetical protein
MTGLQILTGTLFRRGALPARWPPIRRLDVTHGGYRMGGEFEVVDPEATTDVDRPEWDQLGIDLGLYRDSTRSTSS